MFTVASVHSSHKGFMVPFGRNPIFESRRNYRG